MKIEVGGARPSSVQVGRDLLGKLSVPERRRALIVDAGVPRSWREKVSAALNLDVVVEVPAGDACKTPEVWARVQSELARSALPRDAAVIGLGGGATTDLAGFVAATYLRGVAYYNLPTTLLAQVDAAVGGKTGLNLPEGKNLVGAFSPAKAVWCDVDILGSLPGAVFRDGAAEVFKHGLIADQALCGAVLAPGFGPRAPGLEDTVAAAIRVKAEVVTRDPLERGERAHLNFGHTLAHALEAATNHAVSHGEAVGYGMHYAALLSSVLGGADLTDLTRRFLRYQRPGPLPDLSWDALSPFVARDKKADADGVRFVLLRDVGQPYLARVPTERLRATYATFRLELADMLE